MALNFTPDWNIDLIASNQANADVTHNNAILKLEALSNHVIVKSKTTAAQPGSPAQGDAYVIAASATGAQWAGNDGKLAVYINASWWIQAVREGTCAYALDTHTLYVLKNTGWVTVI